jgi:hypothetical protein
VQLAERISQVHESRPQKESRKNPTDFFYVSEFRKLHLQAWILLLYFLYTVYTVKINYVERRRHGKDCEASHFGGAGI